MWDGCSNSANTDCNIRSCDSKKWDVAEIGWKCRRKHGKNVENFLAIWGNLWYFKSNQKLVNLGIEYLGS